MTPTNEQIIAEAKRRSMDSVMTLESHIIEVIREGWTPPEPVDPDLLAFREWLAYGTSHEIREGILTGGWDSSTSAKAYLAGARMAREQERERAKGLVKYVWYDAKRPGGEGNRAREVLAKYEGTL